MAARQITRNAIRCNNCGDVIESSFRNDFVQCSCGRAAVDGGLEYLRRVYADTQDGYTELSEFEDELARYDGK